MRRRSWLAGFAVSALLAPGAYAAEPAATIGPQGVAAVAAGGARALLWTRHLLGPAAEIPLRRLAAEAYRGSRSFEAAEPEWQRLSVLYRRNGDVAGELDTLHARAEIAIARGDYASALALKQAELQGASGAGLAAAEARAESGLGVIARRQGRLDEALARFDRALAIRRSIGDALGEAETLVQLSSAQRNRGDYSRALESLLDSLAIRRRLGASGHVEVGLRALGVFYREVEDYDQAQSSLSEALRQAEAQPDPLAASPVLGSLAALYNDRAQYNQALVMADRALALDERYGNRPGAALDALERGRALLGLERVDEAEAVLLRARTLAVEMGQPILAARASLSLALVAEQHGDLDSAAAMLDSARRSFGSEDARPFLLQTVAALERIAASRADWQRAFDASRQRGELREELLGVQSSRRLAALGAEFERARQQQRIALLEKDNQIQSLALSRERLRRWLYGASFAALAGWIAWLSYRYLTVRRLNATLLERNREIAAQRELLAGANQRLETQANELYEAAISDPLTGVYNRGYLLTRLRQDIVDAERERAPLSLLMTDFDHFKQVNDRHGHLFGDRVLRAAVERMRGALRTGDFVGRYGGEEMIVVLPRTNRSAALEVAQRLRHAVADHVDLLEGVRVGLTVSIGLATLDDVELPSVESLVDAADVALYRAKAAGRNRVVACGEDGAAVVGGA
ncbi:MAG TPA: diguanylate cyclase [Xanthomonadales bacterium]|nr:diguanylate cyclase [Xanthomonadales bacterium]